MVSGSSLSHKVCKAAFFLLCRFRGRYVHARAATLAVFFFSPFEEIDNNSIFSFSVLVHRLMETSPSYSSILQ